MESTEITYIYVLIDPRDNEVRYVGKTSNPKYRLSGHISECKKESTKHYRARWIRSLLKDNIKPIIKFIKACPLNDFEKFETEYIKIFKSDKLTNSDETGQGNSCRIKEVIDRMSKPKSRIVYQYDLDGRFINEYKSVRDAGRSLGIYHSHISRCCNGEYKHTQGFIFRYDKTLVDKVESPNAVRKIVIELNHNDEEIGRWLSIMDCSRDTKLDHGNISRVCNGKLPHIKKRRFIFKPS